MTNNEDLFLPVLLGTGREGRYSEKPAQFLVAELRKLGVRTALIDVLDLASNVTYGDGRLSPTTKPWQEAVISADGLVIVAPEYNHGYPGELKVVLDSLYGEYARKPVAICGVSSGPFGGVRVVEQLRQVVIELSMVPIRNAMYFSNVRQEFGADGQPADAALFNRLKPMFDELLWYSHTLKAGREGK